MRLYVANPTTQNHQFFFRLPEMTRDKEIKIRAGEQECVAGRFEMNADTVDAIVDHHVRYGMVREGEKPAAEGRRSH